MKPFQQYCILNASIIISIIISIIKNVIRPGLYLGSVLPCRFSLYDCSAPGKTNIHIDLMHTATQNQLLQQAAQY